MLAPRTAEVVDLAVLAPRCGQLKRSDDRRSASPKISSTWSPDLQTDERSVAVGQGGLRRIRAEDVQLHARKSARRAATRSCRNDTRSLTRRKAISSTVRLLVVGVGGEVMTAAADVVAGAPTEGGRIPPVGVCATISGADGGCHDGPERGGRDRRSLRSGRCGGDRAAQRFLEEVLRVEPEEREGIGDAFDDPAGDRRRGEDLGEILRVDGDDLVVEQCASGAIGCGKLAADEEGRAEGVQEDVADVDGVAEAELLLDETAEDRDEQRAQPAGGTRRRHHRARDRQHLLHRVDRLLGAGHRNGRGDAEEDDGGGD